MSRRRPMIAIVTAWPAGAAARMNGVQDEASPATPAARVSGSAETVAVTPTIGAMMRSTGCRRISVNPLHTGDRSGRMVGAGRWNVRGQPRDHEPG